MSKTKNKLRHDRPDTMQGIYIVPRTLKYRPLVRNVKQFRSFVNFDKSNHNMTEQRFQKKNISKGSGQCTMSRQPKFPTNLYNKTFVLSPLKRMQIE